MASTTKPTIAFYGATGGSTLAALVPALNAGYSCTACSSPLPPPPCPLSSPTNTTPQ